MFRSLVVASVFCLTMMALPAVVTAAENDSGPWEKYSVSAGGFIAALDTSVRLGSSIGGAGIDFDLEDATGLDSETIGFRLEGMARLGEKRKHRLDFSYFYFNRDATKVMQADLEIGDLPPLTIGDTLKTTFNIQMYKFGYSYSLLRDDRVDLAAGVGLYVMPIKVSVDALNKGKSESESITAPLPSLLLRLDVLLTEKLFFRSSVEFFYLALDAFEGQMSDVNIGLEYKVLKSLGLGLSLNKFDLYIKGDGSTDYPEINLNGKIEFGYTGAMLFAKYYF